MAGQSTYELANFLKTLSAGEGDETHVNAYAFSHVDSPNDLFDRYGRAVADIVVTSGDSSGVNINQWLVESGWTFPDFYNSMSNKEIKTLEEKGKLAEE